MTLLGLLSFGLTSCIQLVESVHLLDVLRDALHVDDVGPGLDLVTVQAELERLSVRSVELVLGDDLDSPLKVLLDVLGQTWVLSLLLKEVENTLNVAAHGRTGLLLLLDSFLLGSLLIMDFLH